MVEFSTEVLARRTIRIPLKIYEDMQLKPGEYIWVDIRRGKTSEDSIP
jgi:hypothetical protein